MCSSDASCDLIVIQTPCLSCRSVHSSIRKPTAHRSRSKSSSLFIRSNFGLVFLHVSLGIRDKASGIQKRFNQLWRKESMKSGFDLNRELIQRQWKFKLRAHHSDIVQHADTATVKVKWCEMQFLWFNFHSFIYSFLTFLCFWFNFFRV